MLPPIPSSIAMRGTLFALALLVLGYSVAGACSVALLTPPTISVRCEANEVHSVAYELPFLSPTPVEQQVDTLYLSLMTHQPCAETLSTHKELLLPRIAAWMEAGKSVRLETYSPEREAKLQRKQEEDLRSCYYDKFERVGEWLVVTGATRDYCSSRLESCPSLYLSPIKFLQFIIQNPSPLTLPYLVTYLPAAMAAVVLSFLASRLSEARSGVQQLAVGGFIWLLMVGYCAYADMDIGPFFEWAILIFGLSIIGLRILISENRRHL